MTFRGQVCHEEAGEGKSVCKCEGVLGRETEERYRDGGWIRRQRAAGAEYQSEKALARSDLS